MTIWAVRRIDYLALLPSLQSSARARFEVRKFNNRRLILDITHALVVEIDAPHQEHSQTNDRSDSEKRTYSSSHAGEASNECAADGSRMRCQ